MSLATIRRIVTAHDASGQAIVASDGPPSHVEEIQAMPGTIFHELWASAAAPARIDNGPDPTGGALQLLPPPHGTRMRIVDFPPESAQWLAHGAEHAPAAFAQMGDARASTRRDDSPHPRMHRTETLDYGVVLEGRITLVLDDSETTLGPGCVVVQRGSNHAWANRSSNPCRMLFVLIDGSYDASIAGSLARR